jgi:hypothetical protein
MVIGVAIKIFVRNQSIKLRDHILPLLSITLRARYEGVLKTPLGIGVRG